MWESNFIPQNLTKNSGKKNLSHKPKSLSVRRPLEEITANILKWKTDALVLVDLANLMVETSASSGECREIIRLIIQCSHKVQEMETPGTFGTES